MAWFNPYRPVETAADFPKFCGVCGRALVNDDHRGWFDRWTGAPSTVRAVRCPKGRFDTCHEAYVVSPRPPIATPPPPDPRLRDRP